MKGSPKTIQYSRTKELIDELKNNNKIIEKVKENIYTKDTVLEDLEKLTEYKNNLMYAANNTYEKNYELLYDKVIQVGEYENIKINQMEKWENYEKNQKGNLIEKIRKVK